MPGLEDTYHSALIVGPKVEGEASEGRRLHAKERVGIVNGRPAPTWELENRQIGMHPTAMLLVRVLVAKVLNREQLERTLESVPVRAEQIGWNCVSWIQEALKTLESSRRILGTSVVDWNIVRSTAMQYVETKKAQHRFDGKVRFDGKKVATFDLLENRETIE